MDTKEKLMERSGSACELCGATNDLEVYDVPPVTERNEDRCILVCPTCMEQINDPEKMDPIHWRCLNDSMWSTTPAVQVTAWRMLDRLRGEGWPVELLDMLYLDEDTLAWAKSKGEATYKEEKVVHVDSNGTILEAGDTVVLIKSLDVKGANMIAKQGTAVRRISLVADNPEHIEGKVNGQHIVILTKYVKKSN